MPLGERGRLRRALQRPHERGHARPADDRRPAAGRDPARPAAAPLRHDHHRRGARAEPEHRLPARLPASGSSRSGPTSSSSSRSATIDPERFAATSATRRSSRSPAARTRSRSATGRSRGRTPTSSTRSATRSSELLARGPGRRARLPQRRARDPRHRRRAAAAASATRSRSCRCTRGCRRAEQQRVFQPHDGRARRAGHERRRDVADRPGHPLRRRPRHRADQPLQRAAEGPAAADRAGLAGVGRPAQGPLRAHRGAASASACTPRRTSTSARASPTRRSCARTSPSVLLQMAALGLGDVEDFPFLDPPDRRQVRDGLNLLTELGALGEGGALTPLGRRLAQLPVDPRLGRMVLEADRLGCADEVIVIAAALSIQDPRERPSDQHDAGRPAARALRRRRLGLPRVPEPVALPARAAARAVGQPVPQALQGRVPAPPARARVAGPRRPAAPGAREARRSRATASRPSPTRSTARCSPGCSRTSGCATPARREYVGARDARFALFPGLGARPQAAAVGDGRRARRDVAAVRAHRRAIDPRVDRAARRAPRQAHATPSRAGTASAAQVVATERVTLYGLPIVAGRDGRRTGASTPRRRASCSCAARSSRATGTRGTRSSTRTGARVEEVEALEERTRRRDLLADDATLQAFFDERVPGDVVSGAHFDRWWRDARRARPGPAHVPARAAAARGARDDAGAAAARGGRATSSCR